MIEQDRTPKHAQERDLDRQQWLLEVALLKLVHEDQWDRDDRQAALEEAAAQRAGEKT